MRLPKVAQTASFKLAALYAALFALSALLLGGAVFFGVESALQRHRAERIQAEIDFFQSKYRDEGLPELIEEINEGISSERGGGLYFAVIDGSDRHFAGNLNVTPGALGWSELKYPANAPPNAQQPLRVLVVDLGNGVRLAIGEDFGLIDEINHTVLEYVGWVLAAFLLVGLAGGWILSVGFLKRVDAITRTADAIIEGNLTSRVALRGTGDDFDRLSGTLNRMLDRISGLLENLRQVSNDIAHDLRTPLTRLRNVLSGASASQNEAELRVAVETAITETDEILETFSALLRIAQVEAGTRKAGFRDLDVSLLMGRAVEDFRPLAEEEGKTLIAEIQPRLSSRGDKELLTQMMANLVDNAIRHTAVGTTITVSLASNGSGLTATIGDDGLGVPEPEREKIFQKFYRLEGSRTSKGTGLGLAFVAAVADLHQIEVSLVDNSPGLRVVLQFPASRMPAGDEQKSSGASEG